MLAETVALDLHVIADDCLCKRPVIAELAMRKMVFIAPSKMHKILTRQLARF